MKQKVFFFAAPAHADESLDGEGCLKDPDTPTFVRRLLGKKIERELPRAG